MRISATAWEEEILVVPAAEEEGEENEHAEDEPACVEN